MVAELGRDGVDDRVVARVLRRLVSLDESEGGRIVARPAPLAAFAPGTAERRLVDAFLRPDMRLLVAEGDMAEARLRIAHEALLTGWARARGCSPRMQPISRGGTSRLEEAERRWQEADPDDRAGLLLRTGLELNEAEALLAAGPRNSILPCATYCGAVARCRAPPGRGTRRDRPPARQTASPRRS